MWVSTDLANITVLTCTVGKLVGSSWASPNCTSLGSHFHRHKGTSRRKQDAVRQPCNCVYLQATVLRGSTTYLNETEDQRTRKHLKTWRDAQIVSRGVQQSLEVPQKQRALTSSGPRTPSSVVSPPLHHRSPLSRDWTS